MALNTAAAWELADWDAVETLERLQRKEVSAAEVVGAAATRAEATSALNAVVTADYQRAVERAATTGPLAGVPTFIKDLAQVEGLRTRWGSAATGDFISRSSDPTVKLLQRTGLVSLGKSATPEFGLTATTEPLALGPTLNPWNAAHSAGGSSGGAAALVAAGVVPLAHGSDGGGSIRIPAACCGLVGLKPSRGRLDMEGSNLLPVNIAVHGVLTRTVRDTVAFWRALESLRPTRGLPPVSALQLERSRPLRIGVFVDSALGGPVDPEVVAATRAAAEACQALGHEVRELPTPIARQVLEDFINLWGFVAWAQWRGGRALVHGGFDGAQVEPWTRDFAAMFSSQLGAGLSAIRRLRRFTGTWAGLFEDLDVLVSPTLAEPAAPLGVFKTDNPFAPTLARLKDYSPFCAVANAAGAPAISLPMGRSAGGLPIGVQFAAARGHDALLLELALVLEEAHPWPRRAPRV